MANEYVRPAIAGKDKWRGQDLLIDCSDKESGHFACITHNREFETPIAKSWHLDDTKGIICVLVWICHIHGPEQP